jgi:glycosyltransferase involved in cell wall biosynthesis
MSIARRGGEANVAAARGGARRIAAPQAQRTLISVIVTTYNREDALDAVLRALSAQTDKRFEVIVADDGSGPATARVIESWTARIGHRLLHVRHEDRGFRAAEIKNRAILTSVGEVCLFLDGDCIPRADFVAMHRRLAEPGRFVAGSRVLLSPEMTERILRERVALERWPLAAWISARRKGEINRILPLLPVPLGPLRRLGGHAWKSARGANLAIQRGDLDRIDGFDAAYSGWGREDSDIIIRLMRIGTRRKDGRFATTVLHLWHPENDRSRLPENDRMLDAVIGSDRIKAVAGISALAPPGN